MLVLSQEYDLMTRTLRRLKELRQILQVTRETINHSSLTPNQLSQFITHKLKLFINILFSEIITFQPDLYLKEWTKWNEISTNVVTTHTLETNLDPYFDIIDGYILILEI